MTSSSEKQQGREWPELTVERRFPGLPRIINPSTLHMDTERERYVPASHLDQVREENDQLHANAAVYIKEGVATHKKLKGVEEELRFSEQHVGACARFGTEQEARADKLQARMAAVPATQHQPGYRALITVFHDPGIGFDTPILAEAEGVPLASVVDRVRAGEDVEAVAIDFSIKPESARLIVAIADACSATQQSGDGLTQDDCERLGSIATAIEKHFYEGGRLRNDYVDRDLRYLRQLASRASGGGGE